MGKPTVPLYTADWQTHNPLFGRCVNPWDGERTPGGGSGGGAATLAGGLTPSEFGSDIAWIDTHPGSILRRVRPQTQ